MYTMCQVKPAFLVVWSRVELAAHEVHVPRHVVHQEPIRSARSVRLCRQRDEPISGQEEPRLVDGLADG